MHRPGSARPVLAMNFKSKLWIAAQTVAALIAVSYALASWQSSGLSVFLVVLALAIATGTMKMSVPGVEGCFSTGYIFIIWGLANLSLGETILLAWMSVSVQAWWRPRKPPVPIQFVFNLSMAAVATTAGSFTFSACRNLPGGHFAHILASAVVYFLVNTFSVAVIIGLTEGRSAISVWTSSFRWSLPHYAASASLVGLTDFLGNFAGRGAALGILPVAYLVYQTFVMHENRMKQALQRAEQERKHCEETANLHLRTISALALAIEAKDQTTGHHIHRVQTYAMEVARDFGLSAVEEEALRAAAILHDIGKLAIPESIISKPGKLTPEEFGKMKTHTVVGAEIVESIAFPFPVAPLVRAHHERWDGSGYPDGLRGEEIPLGARILSVVDFLDALTTDRQYRSALPLEKVMALIVSESGKSFDPRVVEVLVRRCDDLQRVARETMPEHPIVLSTGAAVDRGGAPDAGYATGSAERAGRMAPDRFGHEAALLSALAGRIAGCTGSLVDDLGAIAQALRELIPFQTLALYERSGDLLECRLAVGEEAEFFHELQVESGVGVSGWTVVNRTPLVNGNPVTEFGVSSKVPSGFNLLSAISVPLESEFGPLGALTLYNRAPNAFDSSHLRALLAVSSSLAYRLRADSMFPGIAPALESDAENADVGRQIAALGLSLLGETVPDRSPRL